MSKSIASHREISWFWQAVDACTGLNEAILPAVAPLLLEHRIERQQLQHLSYSAWLQANNQPISCLLLHLLTRKLLLPSDVRPNCSQDIALEVSVRQAEVLL